MQIALIDNGAVAQMGDYRELFPNTSFPVSGITDEFLAEHNAMRVTVWKQHTNAQKLVGCDPYIENGEVFTVQVVDKSAEEVVAETASQAAKVRSDRNRRLSDCDWTQVADAPVDKAAWAVYRQALRDVTTQDGFPWNVTWPVEP